MTTLTDLAVASLPELLSMRINTSSGRETIFDRKDLQLLYNILIFKKQGLVYETLHATCIAGGC